MEVIVLVMVFVSFSMVMVGWYSSFVSMKVAIMKRGQAVFIASNALEQIRINGSIPIKIDTPSGFKVSLSINKNSLSHDSAINKFCEVTVCVEFSDKLDPVCFTTGMLLRSAYHAQDENGPLSVNSEFVDVVVSLPAEVL